MSIKPSVLILVGSFREGGSERQALQLARLIRDDRRCSVRLACLDRAGVLRAGADALGIGEIPEFRLTSFHNVNAIVQVKRFASLLRQLEIDIVHTTDFYTNVFGMAGAWLARVPVRIASRRETAGMRTGAQNWVERWAFRAATAVVANADSVRDLLIEQGVSSEKIFTIHNGVDLDRLSPAPGLAAKQIRRLLGLPEGCSRLVTIVANLRHPVKDLPTFLRAARRVRAAEPGTSFVIAGEGELMGQMRALAEELDLGGAVFFPGRCEKVAELLAISDVCVLSSLAEGFSNSILEYMAAARPVVATDVGGVREAVEHGHTGYLVRPADDEALATHIISLLRDRSKARSMGARGRLVVEQRFSCEAQLERTQRLYGRLLAQRGRGRRQRIRGLSETAVAQAANEVENEHTGRAILEGNHGSL